MSQYAYIPINKVQHITLSYSIANPSTWQFEKNNVQYAGLEEHEFTEAQKNEIETLEGQWFNNATEFKTWLEN